MKGALLAPLLALLHGGVASFVADARLPATWEAGKAERANTIKVNTRVYLRRRHRTHAGHPWQRLLPSREERGRQHGADMDR